MSNLKNDDVALSILGVKGHTVDSDKYSGITLTLAGMNVVLEVEPGPPQGLNPSHGDRAGTSTRVSHSNTRRPYRTEITMSARSEIPRALDGRVQMSCVDFKKQ